MFEKLGTFFKTNLFLGISSVLGVTVGAVLLIAPELFHEESLRVIGGLWIVQGFSFVYELLKK